MEAPFQPQISKNILFTTKEGHRVEEWILRGSGGMEISILNLGGIVRKLLAPNKSGEVYNVVLGFDNPEDYLENPFYFGATVGRVAGRISQGKLDFEGQSYCLLYTSDAADD